MIADRERTAERLQASLDLSAGPLMRAAAFRLGDDQPGRLLWIIHHLVVDAVSWRALLPGRPYLMKLGTRVVQAQVAAVAKDDKYQQAFQADQLVLPEDAAAFVLINVACRGAEWPRTNRLADTVERGW